MLRRSLNRENSLTGLLQALLTLAYPVLFYFALRVASPRLIALAVLALFALRLAFVAPRRLAAYARIGVPVGLGFVAANLVSLFWNEEFVLLLTPVFVNAALLTAFALSFFQRQTVIEMLALEQAGTLSPAEHVYCRRVTALWCAFFLANAAISAKLALDGDLARWTLYVGLIAYVAMGLLFAAEFVYRHWRFRRYIGLPTDPLLRHLFPPDAKP
jgi:uncharacterized membrane protein